MTSPLLGKHKSHNLFLIHAHYIMHVYPQNNARNWTWIFLCSSLYIVAPHTFKQDCSLQMAEEYYKNEIVLWSSTSFFNIELQNNNSNLKVPNHKGTHFFPQQHKHTHTQNLNNKTWQSPQTLPQASLTTVLEPIIISLDRPPWNTMCSG